MVLKDIHPVQDKIKVLSEEFNAKKILWFTGGALLLIVATATIFIPITLAKFTYDKNYFPIVNTEAIAAMKYGPNHSNNTDIAKEVLRNSRRSRLKRPSPRGRAFMLTGSRG